MAVAKGVPARLSEGGIAGALLSTERGELRTVEHEQAEEPGESEEVAAK